MIVVPVHPPVTDVLSLPSPRRVGLKVVVVPPPVIGVQRVYVAGAPQGLVVGPSTSPAVANYNQALLSAQTQVQFAQNGCAQADNFQNYVNSAAAAQNTLDQGTQQVLQSLASATSDPDLQNALLNSAGQPNPINQALQQQLQNTASTLENTCQTRLAAAQANLAQVQAQAPNGGNGAAGGPGTGPQATAPAYQAGYQAGLAASQSSGGPANPAAAPQPSGNTCPPVAASNLPQPIAPWGPWAGLGTAGLVFDVSRVDAKTVTWRFRNAGTNTIAAMNFNYSFVDADTGQQTTQSDVLPFPLAPGQSVGGWAAYTANTRGDISIAVSQISCK